MDEIWMVVPAVVVGHIKRARGHLVEAARVRNQRDHAEANRLTAKADEQLLMAARALADLRARTPGAVQLERLNSESETLVMKVDDVVGD